MANTRAKRSKQKTTQARSGTGRASKGMKRSLSDTESNVGGDIVAQNSPKKAKTAPALSKRKQSASVAAKAITVKKPVIRTDDSDGGADSVMSDNASFAGSDNGTYGKEAVALKIVKYKATLDDIRRKILELESQAMADIQSDDKEELEWPVTPPPSQFKKIHIETSEEDVAAVSKGKAKVAEVEAAEDGVFSNTSEDQVVATNSKSPFKLKPEISPEKLVYLEDYNRPPVMACQILSLFVQEEKRLERATGTRVQLMDPILRKAYGSLPPLPLKAFTSWDENDTPGDCLIMSNWKNKFPDLSLEWLAAGMSFSRDGNFANLARANHREFSLNTYSSICFYHATQPCILLSFLMVHKCCLINARHACNNQKGEAQYVKSIEGFHHSVEFERLQSAILEVYGVDTMPAPMVGGRLTFSSRISSGERTGRAGSSSNMFAPAASPSKAKSLNKTGISKASISPHDEVLIFDATEKTFDFSKKTLDDLERILPKYSGDEISAGSLVMVAYTVSSYLKKGVRNLSPNLNWVVLIREA